MRRSNGCSTWNTAQDRHSGDARQPLKLRSQNVTRPAVGAVRRLADDEQAAVGEQWDVARIDHRGRTEAASDGGGDGSVEVTPDLARLGVDHPSVGVEM